MMDKIKFGDFLREASVTKREISYNDLAAKPKVNESGQSQAAQPEKLKVSATDVYRILAPYTSVRFMEQVQAVVPLALYLMLFQFFVLQQSISNIALISGGLFAVMVGLMLFMEGLKLGLMPFGESIGNTLPVKCSLVTVLAVAFILGVAVTFAEPAIGALKAAGSIVSVEKAPVLYAVLNIYTQQLVLMVGAGVGIAAVLGTMRFVRDWSLKPLIYSSLVPLLGLTAYISFFEPELVKALGLFWDCGAVTTGPVTVPIVLSLGIGVAAAVGSGDSTLSGFGIVTLASLFPIMASMILGIYVANTTSVDQILQMAATLQEGTSSVPSLLDKAIGGIKASVQAIVPLVLLLFMVIRFLAREKVRNAGILLYGIFLAVLGMGIFNIGLELGLSMLGEQAGSKVPAAFAQVDNVMGSPLYIYGVGLAIALAFAFFLGFGATLAEPALNALGLTVQNLTNGAFKKSLLMYSVSFGVAIGIALGVGKLVYNWPLAWLLIPGYIVLLILTYFSSEEFVNVAWDSAGVTTGPVTVPLVLAMGLGFANATGVIEGFGILSMASLCPIMSVLITGLYVQNKAKKVASQATEQGA